MGVGTRLIASHGAGKGALSLTHFGRDWQGIGEDRITHKLSPQGDRKGPHPAPHHSRPYHDYERGITE